jgi:mannose-6-phosphate isomerase-like protein (cupin superfamily)
MGNGGFIMPLVGDPSKPEWFAFRVRYPAGMKTDSAPHFHLGTEHVTVLSGTLVLGIGDHIDPTKVTEYGPGSFVVIEAGTHHFEWFRGEVVSHVEGIGPMRTVWIGRPDTARSGAPATH